MRDHDDLFSRFKDDFHTNFQTLLHDIRDITELEQKTLEQLALKTSEETGELSQAVLSFTKAPGCGYKGKTREDVDEEAVDVIICAAATLFKDQPRKLMYLVPVFTKKLRAWVEKIERERRAETDRESR